MNKKSFHIHYISGQFSIISTFWVEFKHTVWFLIQVLTVFKVFHCDHIINSVNQL